MPSFLFLNFQEYSQMCFELAVQVKKTTAEKPLDYIVSIQRGGAVISKVLSDLLNVPIATITLSTYENLRQVKEPFISQEVSVSVSGKHVLIVDDLSDSGVTLKFVEDYLSKQAPASIRSAVLFTKSHSQFIPDFSVKPTDHWVVFPGEVRETAEALQTFTDLDQKVKDEFQSYLLSQGATPELLQELGIRV